MHCIATDPDITILLRHPEKRTVKISLIVPYFGAWPPWFPAFLLTCRHNPGVEWIFITDCPVPEYHGDNVRFIAGTLQDLNALATEKLGFRVSLSHAYKICDMRPAFGRIFSDYLSESTFWGHCDVDIIWGNIRKFITDEILQQHDVISARRHHIAGHFTLFRNTGKNNDIYTMFPMFEKVLRNPEHIVFDERGMTRAIQHLIDRDGLRVYWPRFLLNFANPKTDRPSRLDGYTRGWYWNRGHLYDQTENSAEIMYLHFMTWKNTLQKIDFGYADSPSAFHITSTAICSETS